MRSGLCYPALFYDDDLFRIPYGAQPVGYHYGCPAFEEGLQVVHDSAFVVGIQCIGCFVEEDEFRVFVHGAGYEYALFLLET